MGNHNHGRRPSPAFLLAALALFVSLGGSAVALQGRNGVNSGDVKNESLKGKDVRSDSLKGADIDESSLSLEPGGPTNGKAGGDLAGSYPDPAIAVGAVTGAKVKDDSLDGYDIHGLSFADMQPETLTGDQIANNTVGADELGPVVTRFGAITIPAGEEKTVTASCAAGEELLGGGGGPAAVPSGPNQVLITDSQRSGTSNTWTLTALNATSTSTQVVAEANCLGA